MPSSKEEIQLSALQTLITSIGKNQLPTNQTVLLAKRILSSSIVQTSSSTSTSSSGTCIEKTLSPAVLKKIQRHYVKNQQKISSSSNGKSNNIDDIQSILSNVQSIYSNYAKNNCADNNGQEVKLVHNVIVKILCRLAGSTNSISAYSSNDNDNFVIGAENPFTTTTSAIFDTDTATAAAYASTNTNYFKRNNGQNQNQNQQQIVSSKHIELAIRDDEQNILRECIHALHYINGDLIRFHSLKDMNGNGDYGYHNNANWNKTTSEEEDDADDEFDNFDELQKLSSATPRPTIPTKYKSIQIRSNLLPFHIPHPSIQTSNRHLRLLSSSTASKDALSLCCECGWLYSRIMNYIHNIRGNGNGEGKNRGGRCFGVVPRALAASLQYEMQNYLLFLANLEQQLYNNTSNAKEEEEEAEGKNDTQTNSSPRKKLTLRQLMVQLRSPMKQLRTMAMLIDGIEPSLNGGQLLTALYLHSIHGDMRHVSLVNRILYSASLPWYDLLYDWCINGVLMSKSSSENEVFIQQNDDDDDVWHGQFTLNMNQIPYLPSIGGEGNKGGLISESLAKDILIVGKGINFIRKCLNDSKWALDVHRLIPQKELEDFILEAKKDSSSSKSILTQQELLLEIKKLLGFHYDSRRIIHKDLSGQSGEIITHSPLERTIHGVAQQVHRHILLSLFEEHHLLDHLKGLKEILFLGQGDFICSLMDGLNAEFESMKQDGDGVDRIYMHNMMGILHDALRSTNAKFLPDFIAQCVHVKLLYSNDNKTFERFWIDDDDEKINEKLDGWDIFSLGYRIEEPLTAVVHHDAMKKYEKVFNLLFRLKRIEWMLNSTWRQSTVLNHAIQHMTSKYGDVGMGSSSSVKDISRMKRLLRTFSMTRQVMLHFVSNVQSYLMFEVLESGWKDLVTKLRCSKTLDEVISAHDEYLDEIVNKSLIETLDHIKSMNSNEDVGAQLRIVLTIAYRFCKVHEQIFSKALTSVDKAAEKRRWAEKRTKAGKWGFDNIDPDVEGQHFYNLSNDETLKTILSISQRFDLALRNLLSLLNDKVNGTLARESVMSSPTQSPFIALQGEEYESNNDSLRFLTFRLDFSEFYNL